jgi:hypothetical protein
MAQVKRGDVRDGLFIFSMLGFGSSCTASFKVSPQIAGVIKAVPGVVQVEAL